MNHVRQNEHLMNTAAYVKAYGGWMNDWAHAFVTVNLPFERSAPKKPEYYLSLWTRLAEANLLGARTLRMSTYDRRIVWLFRREVSADGLIHFHGNVRFPENRRWRGEDKDEYNVDERCKRLESALRWASTRTPDPFTRDRTRLAADIDVRPLNENHGRYLLKHMYRRGEDGRYTGSEELLHDSGLIPLPHLPPKNHRRR